jgi:WD40 repeat protein
VTASDTSMLVFILQTVGEHKDYVNSVASCPEKGDKVASVSDDHTCIVWSADDADKQEACFPLTSPGMTVRWHPKEAGQVSKTVYLLSNFPSLQTLGHCVLIMLEGDFDKIQPSETGILMI